MIQLWKEIADMEKEGLRPAVTVRLYKEEKCFGPGVAELLERTDACGSLRRAAADMGMSYSKAWRIVKDAREGLGFELLVSAAGGTRGGGSLLTPEGHSFIAAYRGYEGKIREYAKALFADEMEAVIDDFCFHRKNEIKA